LTSPEAITVCKATLVTEDAPKLASAMELRGYLGNLFIDDAEFHHHSSRSYHYPFIQYKRIGDSLIVIGLQEYAKTLLSRVSQLDHIETARGTIKIHAVDIQIYTCNVDSQMHPYQFATPWIALNERNYATFRLLPSNQRTPFLEKILVANALSALKWLGIFLDYRLSSAIDSYVPTRVRVHDNSFEAFHARFSLNVGLPDYMGLGKSVSKGFGSIRRV
jgi:hypothetical protein